MAEEGGGSAGEVVREDLPAGGFTEADLLTERHASEVHV